jgi:type IV secretory pathway VirB3-like protein
MNGINVLLSIVFLLIISFIGLIRAETLFGVFLNFILLTFVSYMTLYLFRAD